MGAGEALIRHPLLAGCGVSHGFGVRGAPEPRGLLRPCQVHGAGVAEIAVDGQLAPREADAVVSTQRGKVVGIVSADCVPVLVAAGSGAAVAAIHAGWRGIAAGVVERGVAVLRARAKPDEGLRAVVGPHIGPCCYEVDAPVLEALERRVGPQLEPALAPSRPAHRWLDLGRLVVCELMRAGLARDCIAGLAGCCTCCDASRFFSYRRDGETAGRLVHHIAVGGTRVGFLAGLTE